jgi:hypothetical protein
VFVRDPACRAIVSIDPRPDSQPDERGIRYEYPDNRTERMLACLAAVPGADLGRLLTIERGTDALIPDELPIRPQLAFVDGEHTNPAARRDARFCDAAMHGEGCIVFHDAAVVWRGLGEYVAELESAGRAFDAYVLPDSILVVELGATRLRTAEPVASVVREAYKAFFRAFEDTEPYRLEYRRLTHRILRRLERLASDTAGLLHARGQSQARP